jgi:dsRNA-specific ribonuclease
MENNVYYGPRDDTFKNFLVEILENTGISEAYINKYINEETLPFFNMAFTSKSANPTQNYEPFEQMGDATIGKFIVWSSYQKFPQFRGKPEAVEIVARMKINLGSKNTLSQIAENLGMWDFITASEQKRYKDKKDLLEDVFEALIGVFEFIIHDYSDANYSQPGLAYEIVYTLLLKLFEPYTLKVDYDNLVDSKNRLKAIFDDYKEELGLQPEYKTTREDNSNLFVTRVLDIKQNVLGQGTAPIKKNAEKKAAEMAILTLAKKGYKKTIPSVYEHY